MNDLHRLLTAAADGLAEPVTPPFERVLARAHRRTVLAATSVSTAVLAVTAAAVVPFFLGGHFQSTPRPLGVSGSVSPPSASAKAGTGACSGLTVVADLPGTRANIRNVPAVNAFTVAVGQTITFTASGPCHSYVRIASTPTTPDVLGPLAGVPSASETVDSFSARASGVEKLEVTLETPCTSGPCVLALPVFADITVTVTADSTAVSSSTAAASASGGFGTLSGRALLYGGPPTPGGGQALNGTPGQGVTVTVLQNGAQIASTVTGTDGTFNFQLSPGTYTIKGCGQASVDVKANAATAHDLICAVP